MTKLSDDRLRELARSKPETEHNAMARELLKWRGAHYELREKIDDKVTKFASDLVTGPVMPEDPSDDVLDEACIIVEVMDDNGRGGQEVVGTGLLSATSALEVYNAIRDARLKEGGE